MSRNLRRPRNVIARLTLILQNVIGAIYVPCPSDPLTVGFLIRHHCSTSTVRAQNWVIDQYLTVRDGAVAIEYPCHQGTFRDNCVVSQV